MAKIIKNRKFRLLLACISLLFLVNMIQDSYAKYVTSAEGETNFTIASWTFLVNQQDVVSNNNFSTTIIPVLNQNSNIKAGRIAPTSTGYFDITIDSSNVEVAFDETISLSTGASNTVSDIVFTGYTLISASSVSGSSVSGSSVSGSSISASSIAFQNTTNPTITISHNLNEQQTVNTYRFFIEWDDSVNATMDNSDDVDASISGEASIAVNINFIQRAENQGSGSDPGSGSEPEPEPDPDPGS